MQPIPLSEINAYIANRRIGSPTEQDAITDAVLMLDCAYLDDARTRQREESERSKRRKSKEPKRATR